MKKVYIDKKALISGDKILNKNSRLDLKQYIDDTISENAVIVTLQDSAPEWVEVEVDVTAAQLTANLNSGIDLHVPSLPGKYYEAYVKIEYTHVTTVYDTEGMEYLAVLINGDYKYIDLRMLQSDTNSVAMVSSHTVSGVNNVKSAAVMYVNMIKDNQPITLRSSNKINPTLGDGIIKAKIKYRVITFG